MTTSAAMPGRFDTWLSTRALFVVLLFAGILALTARDVTDPDLWWHLKTGQFMVERHEVPGTDPFSFTRHGQPWVAHEWLSELLMYGTYRVSGWRGLILVFGLLTTATSVFLYLRCAGRPYVAGLVVLWAAFASRPTWGIRPQTLTMLLGSILLWLLDRPANRPRRLWWIVPLTLLWANLHAGYVLGIALLGLFLVGDWLDGVLGVRPTNHLETSTLAKVLGLSLLVVAVNPNGFRLYLYPWETLGSEAMQSGIAEWFSPNFHLGEYAPFLFMLLGLFVVAALGPDSFCARDLLLVSCAAFAALISVRNIPIFVLVATPPITSGASRLFRDLPEPYRIQPLSRARAGVHLAILASLALFVYSEITQVIRRQPSTEVRQFPAAAASFVLGRQPPGPIFNYYNWGGYLIWRLYPVYAVFIDGRADLYGDALMRQFSRTYTLTGDWEAPLETWQIKTVIIPPDCPLAAALEASPGWTVLFRDQGSLVLYRKGGPAT